MLVMCRIEMDCLLGGQFGFDKVSGGTGSVMALCAAVSSSHSSYIQYDPGKICHSRPSIKSLLILSLLTSENFSPL